MNIAGWLFHPSTEHEEVVEPADGVIAGAWSCDTAVSADVTAASKHRLPANSRPPAGRQAPFEAHWQALRSGADTKLLLVLFIHCLNDTTSRKKCTVWSITFLVCFPVLKIKKTRMFFLRLACINNSIYLCLILVNGLRHYVFGLSFRLCVLHAYPGVTILQPACHRLSVTSSSGGVKYCNQHVGLSNCLFVYLENQLSKLHYILSVCFSVDWPWLGPPVMTVLYVVYCHFCGRCHVFP